jgi:hypothetical protein
VAQPTPVAPVAPITPPPIAAGPLPSYGAEFRAPAPAAQLPTAPAAPAAAAPVSAPAGPSPGAGPVTPSVVRQATPQPTPALLGQQVATATASGALTGVPARQLGAQARLRRLVDFVARQEPRLSWAAGDRPDGSTVLVTDLAGGWIPPGIEIPSGVQLLDPAPRRGNLESLLGEVTVTSTYTSGQHLPTVDDPEPVSTSVRARQGPVVDELGWELGRVTKWRDGLPRLAHTLAKAATARTGILDSEIALLRADLTAMADQVLDSCPGSADASVLGNWQLLAVIDALVGGDKVGAHYHFAWFQALNHGS